MRTFNGPWILVTSNLVRDQRGNAIHGDSSAIKSKENARLIASAPELLEACNGALVAIKSELSRQGKSHWGLDNAVSYLENAIAKALGDS